MACAEADFAYLATVTTYWVGPNAQEQFEACEAILLSHSVSCNLSTAKVKKHPEL